ncbi:hypothetical protein DUT91_03460 [Phyllobacterium salinisoli]|uniref:Uncharacterized protein n=1 Tax=Phyllobacterium salinisoli TaxID=1899321 RepID=A0A368KCM0_9HYPH|nr:hypothetical protein [Phyllobacterium salinisoli]RCS25830.1 hypothetical protein DUT91_03460 [Phyllobacterium salinisoli]
MPNLTFPAAAEGLPNASNSENDPRNPHRLTFLRKLLVSCSAPAAKMPCQILKKESVMNQHVNRRSLLAASVASTVAAGVVTADAAAAPRENPELIALAAEFPSFVEAYQVARRADKDMRAKWKQASPLAPDELTVCGSARPQDNSQHPGEAECDVWGMDLLRPGEEHPRRIVVGAWRVNCDLSDARRHKRRAKKDGSVADFLHYEEEERRLKKLLKIAETYEKKYSQVRADARAEEGRFSPVWTKAREALGNRISAIMDAPDWTVEGLIIKAEVLAEWDRVCQGVDRPISMIKKDWHGQIAASILRHAKGGTA